MADTKVISESTPIRLGVIGFCIMVFIGVLGFGIGAVWFASSISTKMDILMDDMRSLKSTVPTISDRLSDHEGRLKNIVDRLDRIDKK